LNEKSCSGFLETLKVHGFHRVAKMPKEFVAACNDLYPLFQLFREINQLCLFSLFYVFLC